MISHASATILAGSWRPPIISSCLAIAGGSVR